MADKQLQLGDDSSFVAAVTAWERVVDELGRRVDKPTYESWIRTARPLSLDDGTLHIGVGSAFQKQWLENKHLPAIKEALEHELGQSLRIKVEVVDDSEPAMLANRLPRKPAPRPRNDADDISQPLNPRYTFDSFVVGPTNRLAHACASAVAESPGRTYNPLFIYGGVGLGKTHLMHALGQAAAVAQPGIRIACVSGEAFTYHYITSLREHRASEFRRKYRSIDLWLVDDVQFLAGKERTEEEFFHTYNALYEMGKQVVLTSDRAPKEIELDRRLLSRFECGMVTDISPPDLETRIAILQSKARADCMSLSDDVILYIARLITSNIRQLEGALVKLHAYASLMRTSVTPDLAHEVLGAYFGEAAATVVDVNMVAREVSRRFDVEVSDLKGKCRSREIVIPRQVAMYLTRQLTDLSLPAIGRAFGGRDHTTVIHACRKVEEKAGRDKGFAALLEDLERRIRGKHGAS